VLKRRRNGREKVCLCAEVRAKIHLMPLHVYMFEYWNPTRTRGQGYYFLNLTEEELRDRIVAPWDRGDPVTWDGRTAESSKSMIEVYRTADPIDRATSSTKTNSTV
jgi:hypothetical protein